MSSTPKASPRPAARLVQPDDHALILIDYQPQMAFATKSIDPVELRNNAALLSKAAAGFGRHDPDYRRGEVLLRADVRGSDGPSPGRSSSTARA